MARKIWFISDTHFNHKNILTFKNDEGELTRPGFDNIDDMNQCIINKWNSRVQDDDIIYHLGDVAFGNKADFEEIMKQLKGRKRLILGNHDCWDMKIYRNHFQKIMSWRRFDEDVTGCDISFIACHYPLHKSLFERHDKGLRFCLHGHTHVRVLSEFEYINVCVEHTNFAPISMDEILVKATLRVIHSEWVSDI